MDKEDWLKLPLGERLRQARTLRKLGQAELARMSRLQATSISMFESGKRRPGLGSLIKMADALDVSIDYLVGRTDNRAAHLSAAGMLGQAQLGADDLEWLKAIVRRLAIHDRP